MIAEPRSRGSQHLGVPGQVPVRVLGFRVAQVCGEQRQSRLDVDSGGVPFGQRSQREGVS